MHLLALLLSSALPAATQTLSLSRHNDDKFGRVGGIATRRLRYVSSTLNEQARSAASSLKRKSLSLSLNFSALSSNVHLLLLSKHYLSWAKHKTIHTRTHTHTLAHSRWVVQWFKAIGINISLAIFCFLFSDCIPSLFARLARCMTQTIWPLVCIF